jgi:hypothetical protein
MTQYRLDHAVVMDTDDIPGRGGYALVGISRGVTQAERLFVAQNFGISDFLHDPQNDRTFYSFFRVPGGRRAFTRRFANGRRRNDTQNRLFVHTLFFDDALFDGLAGLPWLLLEGKVRAEGGDGEWQPLRNDVPWVGADGSLPALELELDESVLADVPRRLTARLALAGKEVANAPAAAAATLGALRDQQRVVLPQGRGHEWLTLLVWSMLPRRDREELAWTQHDTLNVGGVTFHLANAVSPGTEGVALDRPAPPVGTRIVALNTDADGWGAFHEYAVRYGLSVRRGDLLEACLAHRDALLAVDAAAGEPELRALAETGKRLRGQTCLQHERILDLLWRNVDHDNVARWASRIHTSGLDQVIFGTAPDPRWLDRAAGEDGADLVVEFFERGMEHMPAASAARTAVAQWVTTSSGRGLKRQQLARLVVRAYAERDASRRDLLIQLLADDAGLATLQKALTATELPELVYDATVFAVEGPRDVRTFLREVFVPYVERFDKLAEQVSPELLLQARSAWTPPMVGLVTKLVGRASASVMAWTDLVTALSADFAGTAQRAGVSELVAQYWTRVKPEDVPRLTAPTVDAIAHITGSARRGLLDTWKTRIRRLPDGGMAERLLKALYGDVDGAAARELRIPLAWRKLEQGKADEATLNRLDVALYDQQGSKYGPDMADAIATFLGSQARVARVRKLCELLRSPLVLPTVKRVIETLLLPDTLKVLNGPDWNDLTARAQDQELFCRGAATLTIAWQLGAQGDENAIRQFESACRAHRRSDAEQSLAAGRRSRGLGRRVGRLLGMEPR